MIAKIIVASIVGVLSIIGFSLFFNEVVKEPGAIGSKTFFRAMIAISSIIFIVAIMWLIFFLK